MLGSAAGALLPAPLLPVLGEGRIVLLPALMSLAPAFLLSPVKSRRGKLTAAGCLLLAGVTLGLLGQKELLTVTPSPYKLLPQARRYPGTRILDSRNSLRARVDRIESPAIRFAPGLSLTYQGDLENNGLLVEDADTLFSAYPLESLDFARFTISYSGYVLLPGARRVLIAQKSGGLAAAAALAAGAEVVRLLVELPEAARFYSERYRCTGVEPVAAPTRSYVAGSRELFDLVPLENWGPSYPGAASLEQDYSLTVEALEEVLAHLEDAGLLVLSRRLRFPPADCLRAYGTVYEALRRRGAERPARHIAVVRSWDVYTLLASPSPLTPEMLERLKGFCRNLSFDLVAYDGMPVEEANRYNLRYEPAYYLALQQLRAALEAGGERAYFRDYPLAVRPAGDDRCFFNRFTRWLRLRALLRGRVSRIYSLLLSGEVVVLAVLLVALILGAALLLLPLRFMPRPRGTRPRGTRPRGTRAPAPPLSTPPSRRGTGYFLAGGGGFMLVEMGFIQAYLLIFEDPVLCFSVLLCTVLLLSASGGAFSSRLRLRDLKLLLAALGVYLSALCILLFPVLRLLLSLPAPWREALALLPLLPPAFAIGIFFPAGLRLLVDRPEARAYAWAANGIASVLAAVLAVPLAMAAGISRVLLLAAFLYLLALVSVRRRQPGI